MSILITNIQRTSFHDGDGIRTTVFFKGCNLHCPWCANPENISDVKEYYLDSKRCIANKGKCLLNNNCSILSNLQFDSVPSCPIGAIGVFGKEFQEDELFKELIKDICYFKETGGGITFSGGEPLKQLYKIENVLKKLKNENINLAVETSLFVPKKLLKIILPYIDVFYIDVKSLEEDVVKKVLNGNIKTYLENIKIVFNISKKIIFRMPLVPAITITDRNLQLLETFLNDYHPSRFEFFSVHNYGEKKYKLLGKSYVSYPKASRKTIDFIENICKQLSIPYMELKI